MQAKLSNIRAFCLTYELGSFTQAAKVLGVTPQAASRAVARLEQALGAELLRRNTRHVNATEAGRVYYEACRTALDTLNEAEAHLAGDREELAGEVRVSAPTTYGHHRFIPMLTRFRQKHPRVVVDVQIANRNVDFVREGFDLAIRMGALEDASFIARRLGDFSLGVFASPTYLEARGTPTGLDTLSEHACALFVMPRTGRLLPWTFDPEPKALIPEAGVRIRDDVLGLVTFARAGGGLVQMYHFLVEQELKRGELIEVLEAYRGRSRPFSLIYPSHAAKRPAVRALIDFVVEQSKPDRNLSAP